MTRTKRFAVYGMAAMYGGVVLCIGGVSKPVAFLFVGVGLIVASMGVLTDKGEPQTPAHHVRERDSALRPRAGSRPR